MSIHILVPQERLADLLFAEHELLCIKRTGKVPGFSYYGSIFPEGGFEDPCVEVTDYSLETPSEFLENLNGLLAEGSGGLANYLGYQYTVETNAAYFENLEDMLDTEE